MAGNYPDVPSNRIAFDRDGTQAYMLLLDGTIYQLTNAQLVVLNNESNDSLGGFPVTPATSGSKLVFFFPELRDINAYFWNAEDVFFGVANVVFEVSTNTTNGLDGTWTAIGGPSNHFTETVPYYRTDIHTAGALGIKACRFRGVSGNYQWGIRGVHLFGNVSPGQNPNRLAIWHPTSDLHVTGAYFDWGNAPRGSSADRTFRVKNVSSTLTAVSPQVILEALTDTTPSVPGQTLLSTDGTTFGAGITLSSLAPGGLSPVCTVRRVTPSNAVLSVWAWRMVAQATSWT